jgi:hypothetical protein
MPERGPTFAEEPKDEENREEERRRELGEIMRERVELSSKLQEALARIPSKEVREAVLERAIELYEAANGIQDSVARGKILIDLERDYLEQVQQIAEADDAKRNVEFRKAALKDKISLVTALVTSSIISTAGVGIVQEYGPEAQAQLGAASTFAAKIEKREKERSYLPEITGEVHPETRRNIIESLRAMPGTFRVSIAEIRSEPDEGETIKHYGSKLKDARALATAGYSHARGGTIIKMYNGVLERPLTKSTAKTFRHEVTHAGDDQRNTVIDQSVRDGWAEQMRTLTKDPNRFRHWYPDAIESETPEQAVENKRVELFAVIGEVYFAEPEAEEILGSSTFSTFDRIISEANPDFVRLDAVRKNYELFEVNTEQLITERLGQRWKFTAEEQDDMRDLFERRKLLNPEIDPQAQALAREELVRLCAEFGTSDERKKLVLRALQMFAAREGLLDAVTTMRPMERVGDLAGAFGVTSKRLKQLFSERVEAVDPILRESDEEEEGEQKEFLRRLSDLVLERDVVIGRNNRRFTDLGRHEIIKRPEDLWVFEAADWFDRGKKENDVRLSDPHDQAFYDDWWQQEQDKHEKEREKRDIDVDSIMFPNGL